VVKCISGEGAGCASVKSSGVLPLKGGESMVAKIIKLLRALTELARALTNLVRAVIKLLRILTKT